MLQIGRFKLRTLEFGRFTLDGGAMFGVVPRVLWEKVHRADEKNRVEMALRCLLISFEDRNVLVDTGFGEGRSKKFTKIYNFRGNQDYMQSSLSKIGLKSDDITDVILTHLHFDHCGGSTVLKTGSVEAALKNARYYIQKRQLEHARSRFMRDKASYLPEDFEPLINGRRAEIVDGYWELIPGIDVVICEGHTPAMQLVRINDGGQTVLYCADLIPLASHLSLPWVMSYDLYPVKTIEEKGNILEQAVAGEWTLIFEHDPEVIMGKVQKDEKGNFVMK